MNPARWITLILIALVLLAAFGTLKSCQSARTAKTETKLAKGQAGAAIESGRDAVETIGIRAQADAAADAITQENNDAIRNAEGASAPVAAGARDAGLASLCRRAAYHRDPKCVLGPNP